MRDAKTMSALAVLLVGVSFADPPTQIERAKPTLGEYPAPPKSKPAPPPVPRSPDEPRVVGLERFVLFWINDYTGTVPVRWTVTPLDAYGLADTVAVPKGSPVVGILAGELRAKAHYPPDGSSNVVALWGVSKGRVLLQADGVKDNQIVTLVKVTIDVGGPQSPQPPPDDPPETPPTKPPGTAKVYFLAVRPDGPARPDFVAAMGHAAWDKHRAAGRTVKEMTLTESQDFYKAPAGTVIPYVVTLAVADGTAKVIAGPVPLPTDGAGIDKLAEGIR